jgi:hypothetical protein
MKCYGRKERMREHARLKQVMHSISKGKSGRERLKFGKGIEMIDRRERGMKT